MQLTGVPADGPSEKMGNLDSVPVALDTIPVALDSVPSVLDSVPLVWIHGKSVPWESRCSFPNVMSLETCNDEDGFLADDDLGFSGLFLVDIFR